MSIFKNMDLKQQYAKENKAVAERYGLAMERIEEIYSDTACISGFEDYFKRTAQFLLQIKELLELMEADAFEDMGWDELEAYNQSLYRDILGQAYETSYANPAWAASLFGREFGQLLSFVYTELRSAIGDAYEGRRYLITTGAELFIEIYNLFEQERPAYKTLKDTVYWYVSDYADIIYAERLRASFDPALSFGTELIMESCLEDERYLFRYGEYITSNERRLAGFINSLPEQELLTCARTYVEGYKKGFELAGKPLHKKKTVNIRYAIGMERMVREAILMFREIGLSPIIYRYGLHSVAKNGNAKIGFHGTPANRQYEYDHRFDQALYLDRAFYERKLSILKVTYEKYKDLALLYAGPAVIEVFGGEPFSPVNKPDACVLSEKQQKLSREYANESAELVNRYMPMDEASFTIIAFPSPEIGENFPEIFKETVKLNTLDYESYKKVQQCIIDTLDKAEYVRILGANGNRTDLTVQLQELKNPEKETKFENCLADVNIPVGEVFTSPKLIGTNGLLHVKQVYLRGLNYLNLAVEFKDGCISGYSCSNFDREEENKAYFRENVMHSQDTLPLGEFAIGTNTAAYVMARKYNILHRMPILIVEKMGPHFAVGDTCYNRSEEVRVYNPDGKEIIAKENDFSQLRKSEPDKAYFNCHTDITIPYDEIGEIACCTGTGEKTVIIQDGRFVLPGTELLNEAFQE